jgi:hypothetical protein
MINLGLGVAWTFGKINRFVSNMILAFRARVYADNGVFEAPACLAAQLEELRKDQLLSSASFLVTPNAVEENKLFAIVPSSGLGDLDVVRATTATRVNSAGLIEQVPYNLLQRSEQFENAVWLAGGSGAFVVTTNSTTAPNGTLTADKLIAPLTNQTIRQNLANINTAYTLSIYLKTNSGTKQMRLFINDSEIQSVINVTSDWQRFTLSGTVGNTLIGAGRVGISNVDILDNSSFVYIWGAQLVTGTSAKEYFPTTDRLDVPRLDYTNSSCPSILVEPQRTNLVTYSEQLDNAAWVKTAINITANSTTSPDGTTTADKFIPTSATSLHITESSSVSFVSGTTYTFSFYGKKAENNFIQFTASSALLGTRANFDLNSGVLGTVDSGITATITSIGNDGWYRCTATFTASVTGSYKIILTAITNSTAVRFQSFAGNNVNGLFLWGAQLEVGANATSYIPTVASTVTRNADVISKTAISSLIGTTYTVYGEIINEGIHNARHLVLKLPTGGNYADVVFIVQYFNGLQATANNSTSTAQFTINSGSYSIGQTLKYALRCEQNNVAFYINGVQIGVDTLCTIPAVSTLYIGNYVDLQLGSKIKSTMIFPSALTNTELAQLTTL